MIQLMTSIRDQQLLRESFDALSRQTFGLSFTPWYNSGFWGPSFLPHTLVCDDRVISNISVNFLTVRLHNQLKRYIQLGTVMTDPSYRKQGLSRRLMEYILSQYGPYCDGLYLFANDSVLDFYPKFGFHKAKEFIRTFNVSALPTVNTTIRQLNMDDPSDRQLLLQLAMPGNPYSALTTLHQDPGLLMFYCLQFYQNNLYYIPELRSVAVMEYDDSVMRCLEVFGNGQASLPQILGTLKRPETKEVQLFFSTDLGVPTLLQEPDTTLFIWDHKNDPFSQEQLCFSPLTHT